MKLKMIKAPDMKNLFIVCILAIIMPATSEAGEFKLYPGSVRDSKLTRDAKQLVEIIGQTQKNQTPTVYTSAAPFEKVAAYYGKLAREYIAPGMRKGKYKKLPSGRDLKEAYFIFDDAPDLAASKLWVKIQRPYVGRLKNKGTPQRYNETRDVTVILVVEQK